jgi:chromosomal replication initiation ATPase DnaA
MGSADSIQLVLALGHAESYARDDFVAGPSNAAALSMVESWPDWPDRIVAICGPEGAGKSHLAMIWADKAGARSISAPALGYANLPLALATGALVVEDINGQVDERALFHLINMAREHRAYVLMTSRSAPSAIALALPDLVSRLRAIPSVAVAPPDDDLLRALIAKLAADRQLDLDPAVVSYLSHRVERSFRGARSAIERLDREALRLHRPVTRALAAELFRADPA